MRCCYVIPYLEASESLKATISTLLRSDDNIVVVAVHDMPKRPKNPLRPTGERNRALSDRLHVLHDGLHKGYTRSINVGAKLAIERFAPDLLCLLNDDVLLPNNKIPALGRLPDDAGLVGIVSNRAGYQSLQYCFDGAGDFLYPEYGLEAAIEKHRHLVERIGAKYLPVPLVHGFGFYVRSGVFVELGLLDEECFPTGYGSDFDLSLRAEAAGHRNYVWTGDFVWHIGSATSGREQRRIKAIGADFMLKRKHGSTYVDAQFKTRMRMDRHTRNYLELA